MGRKSEQELPPSIYRFDPATAELTLMENEVVGPNGLAFSPDERTL
jgi:gluconolactonase